MTAWRLRGAHLVAVGSVLAVLGSSTAFTVFYAERTRPPDPEAARWFADHAVWGKTTDGDGNLLTVASVVGAHGLELSGSLPAVMDLAVDAAAVDRPDSVVWTAVTTVRYPDGSTFNVPEVYLADDDGVTQVVGVATILLPVAFEPPLVALPAEVEEGRSWSQQGQAAYGTIALYDYAQSSEILAVEEDGECAVVSTHTTYEPTQDGADFGATAYDDTVESTVCRGRWVTAARSSSGTTDSISAATARTLVAGFPDTPTEQPPADGETGPALLSRRAAASRPSADTVLVPEADTVVDSDLDSRTVTGLAWSAETIVPRWRLVGEGPTVVAPLARGSTLVVADTHGLVTALDARSGFVLWQERVGRLPHALAADDQGRYVAVLDRTGSATLLTMTDGGKVAEIRGRGDPIGIAVLMDDDEPVVVVADSTSVRGYDADGEETMALTDVAPSSGPAVSGDRAFVGTSDGHLVAFDARGEIERVRLDFNALTDLIAGTAMVAALNGTDRLYLLRAGDLTRLATIDDDGDALTTGHRARSGDLVVSTAQDGRVTVYDPDGRVRRTVDASVTTAHGFEGAQHAAAVTWDDAVWVSAIGGLTRWGPE